MSTITATPVGLAPASQALIDLRLDIIDRLLLNHLPRQDRVNIVSEVEAQIFELLGESGSEEPTRDDVLAVLARLDPPEAYVPEDSPLDQPTGRRESARSVLSERSGVSRRQPRHHAGRASKTGAILGLVSLSMTLVVPALYTVGLMLESWEIALFGILLAGSAMFVTGLLGLIFSIASGVRSSWSIAGLITSAMSLLIWLGGGLLVLIAGV